MINLHMNMFTPQIYIYTLMKQIKEKMNNIHSQSHTHTGSIQTHSDTHTQSCRDCIQGLWGGKLGVGMRGQTQISIHKILKFNLLNVFCIGST